MVKRSRFLDVIPDARAAVSRQLMQPDRAEWGTVTATPESDVSVPAGSLEVAIDGSDLPPVVVPADGGITAVGAKVMLVRDSSGRVVRASTPARLPAGAVPVAVGVTGEWLAGLDSLTATLDAAQDALDQRMGQADVDLAGARSDIAQAQSDLAAAQTQLGALAGGVEDVRSVAESARSQAQGAADAAVAAQGAADQARTDAASAAGIAGGKADVLIQAAAPAVAMRKATTLWIDTTGGANTPKRWSGSAWVAVTDKAATDAASAAAAAQSTESQAGADAAAARSAADAAQAAALSAQSAADAASARASTADGRVTVAAANPTTTDAAGKPIGAVWEVRSGATILRRFVLTAATTWTQVKVGQDFVGAKAIGQAQIGDLAVGTGQIADLAVTDAKVGSMSVGKLTAGTANLDSAVVQKLSVAIATVIQLSVDRLVAGSGTLNEATAKKLWADIATFGDVKITGSLLVDDLGAKTISGGKISGGTVVGAKVATADTGVRMILGTVAGDTSSPGIWMYDANNAYRWTVQLNDGIPRETFMDDSGTPRIRLNQNGLSFSGASSDLRMFLNDSGLSFYNPGSSKKSGNLASTTAGASPVFAIDGPESTSNKRGTMWIYGDESNPKIILGCSIAPNAPSGNATGLSMDYNGTWRLGWTDCRIYSEADSKSIDLYSASQSYKWYNLPTTTSAGSYLTMVVGANGEPWIYRNTSVRAAKMDIRDIQGDPYRVLNLQPRDWIDRGQAARQAAGMEHDDLAAEGIILAEARVGAPRVLPRIPGFVAEEVEDVLPELATYDDQGDLVGVMYDRVPAYLLLAVRALKAEVDDLKTQIGVHSGD